METWTETCGPIPGDVILTHTHITCEVHHPLVVKEANKLTAKEPTNTSSPSIFVQPQLVVKEVNTSSPSNISPLELP